MPGLVPGIHVFLLCQRCKDVDGRDKPGHDEFYRLTTDAALRQRSLRELKAFEAVQFFLDAPLQQAARLLADPGPFLHQ